MDNNMETKNIIYGVAGEGMGHAIRSSVVIEHLLSQGHNVAVISYGRAYNFLKNKFNNIETLEIAGLTISYKNNKVLKMQTLLDNLALSKSSIDNYKKASSLFKQIKPDLVMTDFEPWSNIFARYNKVPVIAIDNIQVVNRCKIDKGIKGFGYKLSKSIIKTMTPKCNHYMITTFFDIPIKKDKTNLYSPILRKQILDAKNRVEDEGHILVYQTSDSAKDLIHCLKNSKERFIVYGGKRDINADEIDGNLIFRPFSEFSFINDLRECKAVISGGSFTVMSECIYLNKPLLSVPVEGQYEQEMNAYYLEKMGYGLSSKHITKEILDKFLNNINDYKSNLKNYKHDDKLFSDLDNFILSLK